MKFLLYVLFGFVLFCPACAITDVRTDINIVSLTELDQYLKDVVVKVEILVTYPGGRTGSGHGSGVIVAGNSNKYYVLTCNHVVDITDIAPLIENCEFWIHVYKTHEAILCKVIAYDEGDDLALLEFESKVPLRLAKIATKKPEPLSIVWARGYAGQYGAITTKGIFVEENTKWGFDTTGFTHTAHGWYGCSGGGIFNTKGELIGTTARVWVDDRRGQTLPWIQGIVPFTTSRKFIDKALER